MKSLFQDVQRPRKSHAAGPGSQGRSGEARRVTCSPEPRSALGPADVTIREFKSPQLGGSAVQFYGSSTRRRGPPGVTPRGRVAPLELGRSPRGGGAEPGHGRGPRSRTPTACGDSIYGRGPRLRARTPARAKTRAHAQTPWAGTPAAGAHPERSHGPSEPPRHTPRARQLPRRHTPLPAGDTNACLASLLPIASASWGKIK